MSEKLWHLKAGPAEAECVRIADLAQRARLALPAKPNRHRELLACFPSVSDTPRLKVKRRGCMKNVSMSLAFNMQLLCM